MKIIIVLLIAGAVLVAAVGYALIVAAAKADACHDCAFREHCDAEEAKHLFNTFTPPCEQMRSSAPTSKKHEGDQL